MPKATSPTDRRTKAGKRRVNGFYDWKDLAQAAYKKQLAPKEVASWGGIVETAYKKQLALKEKTSGK